MAKQKKWKEKTECKLDIDDRDAATVIFGRELYIGETDFSHGMIVCEQVFGMYIEGDTFLERHEYMAKNGITFYRDEIKKDIDEDKVLFGHLIGDKIYWDCFGGSREKVRNMILNCKDKKTVSKYSHYYYNPRTLEQTKLL